MRIADVIALAAGLAWIATFACWIASLMNLSGRSSTMHMLVHGFEMLNSENFTERGRRWQKGFFGALALFAVVVVGGMVAASLAGKVTTRG